MDVALDLRVLRDSYIGAIIESQQHTKACSDFIKKMEKELQVGQTNKTQVPQVEVNFKLPEPLTLKRRVWVDPNVNLITTSIPDENKSKVGYLHYKHGINYSSNISELTPDIIEGSVEFEPIQYLVELPPIPVKKQVVFGPFQYGLPCVLPHLEPKRAQAEVLVKRRRKNYNKKISYFSNPEPAHIKENVHDEKVKKAHAVVSKWKRKKKVNWRPFDYDKEDKKTQASAQSVKEVNDRDVKKAQATEQHNKAVCFEEVKKPQAVVSKRKLTKKVKWRLFDYDKEDKKAQASAQSVKEVNDRDVKKAQATEQHDKAVCIGEVKKLQAVVSKRKLTKKVKWRSFDYDKEDKKAQSLAQCVEEVNYEHVKKAQAPTQCVEEVHD